MQAAGIIVEYNPLHRGHVHLMQQTRRLLGEDCAIICAMSGDFVQRGDFALLNRRARARAAVESGADLVLELPLPWAVASAERFADGGVQTLLATGLLTHLAFGSECGDAERLMTAAKGLEHPDFPALLKDALKSGASFPAARQSALEQMLGQNTAALLASPNNTLGIEYCRALVRQKSAVSPLTISRLGAEHDAPDAVDGIASGSSIRALLHAGQREEALSLMAPAMAQAYLREEAAGRAPVFSQTQERAILARLRTMTEADFAALDESREGLYHRLYQASRTARTVEEFLETAKTRRYAYARLRRMLLWAYLGLDPHTFPAAPAYLRPLAANETGRALLGAMRKTASVPVLTKPADVRRLGTEALDLFTLEARAADLYSLSYPDLSAAAPEVLWKEGLVLL